MILINLLPEELRRQEGTPLPRRLAIFAGAGLLTLLGFLLLIQRARTLPSLRDEKKGLGQELLEANGRIQRDVAPVQRSLEALERRRKAFQQIRENAVRWAGRLDGLQAVLIDDLDGVWIDAFGYEERQSKEKGKGDRERVLTVSFIASDFSDGHTLFSMSNEEKIAQVGRRLAQNRGFMQDVIGMSPSTWAVTDDFLKVPWNVKAITFPISFSLRAPASDKPQPPPSKPAEPAKG